MAGRQRNGDRARRGARPAPVLVAAGRALVALVLLAVAALTTAIARAADADAQSLPLAELQTVRLELRPVWSATERRIAVSLSFDAGGRHATPLELPTAWAGAHGFAEGIRNLRSTSRDARLVEGALPHQRRVLHPPRGTVTIAWDLVEYGNPQLTDRRFYQPLLRPEYALFFGHGAWVLPAWHPQQPLRAVIALHSLPKGWTAATSFGVLSGRDRTRFLAENIVPGTLRHAVYAFGDFRLYRTDIAGQPLWIALRGKFGFDDASFVGRTAALVRAQREFFGDTDFPFYLITLMPNDYLRGNNGGTGIHNAFAMHVPADFSVPGYAFEFLIGHENLHTWVPRRFGSMDSAEGVNDEALRYWFSEGFTNFLTHRLLLASGQWSLVQYAQALNGVIRGYELSEVRSRDNAAVRALFFSDRAVGQLPYQRGELLALRWDMQLRARGQSLAAVMRSLLLPAAPSAQRPPLATERLLAALEPHLGRSPREDVQRVIEQAGAMSYDDDLLGPCFFSEPTALARWELGFDGARSFRERQVLGLVPGTAAERAGLREGDRLRGFSVYGGDVDKDAELTVERDGQPIEIRYRPIAERSVPGVRYVLKPEAAQEPACQAWMALK